MDSVSWAISSGMRAHRRQRHRGHDLLPLQPPHLAQRSGQPARPLRDATRRCARLAVRTCARLALRHVRQSTHDTKRGEDVRARLSVLSERTRAWRREVRAWARLNRHARSSVERMPAPSANLEYYLYQTLAATWEGDATPEFIERIEEHLIKAMREAKETTSWMNISEPHEAAARSFVREILGARRSARFRARLDGWVSNVHEAAAINSLAMIALKCTAPGI